MGGKVPEATTEDASVSMPMLTMPPVEGSRTYPEDTKLGFKLFEPLIIRASAVAAAPLQASVQPDVEHGVDMSSYTPVYRKVSRTCKIALILASALLLITLLAIGIYFLARNYVPVDLSIQNQIGLYDDYYLYVPT